ncbi:MAG TPA: glycoside hydrolase family 28 protein [Verrucomicrobiae bacterium]|nr:glycoside hydrolase family 28 protein [Verrucomicrobiae bacterium]
MTYALSLRRTLSLAIALPFFAASCATENSSDPATGWARLPDILKRIVPPQFPARLFTVTDYGAIGDGTNDSSQAFQKAITECSSAGGGSVVVPEGTFLTGPIHLQNNVNLHLNKGAIIRFSTNPDDYLPVVFTRFEGTEVMNYSPLIYAFEKTNIAVTGEGTIDGQASDTAWHDWARSGDPKHLVDMANQGVPTVQRIFGKGHHLRPNFVEPVRCHNVLIEGVTILNSPMWVLSPVYCTNVTIRKITIKTKGTNTDGCDPDSCSDVLIEGCSFSDGDDCIAIKSGRDRDGQKVNIPCRNLVVKDCHFEAGHGGIAIGSETSGGIENVFGENCNFDSPDLEMALRFKTNPARGGYIQNVFIRNCAVKTAQVGVHMTLRYGSNGAMNGESVPIIRDVHIQDCTFSNLTTRPIFIQGWSPTNQITDVSIVGCNFLQAMEDSVITNASNIDLSNTQGARLAQKSF